MTKHRPPIDDEVTIVYERDRPVAVTMPYAAYERLRGVDPFADRPLSRDPVDLAIARAGDKANAAEATARRRVAAREDRDVTETVPAEVARALAAGVTPPRRGARAAASPRPCSRRAPACRAPTWPSSRRVPANPPSPPSAASRQRSTCWPTI